MMLGSGRSNDARSQQMRWWGHTRWGLRYRGHVIYHPAKTYHPAKILDGGTIQDGKHHPKGYGMAEECGMARLSLMYIVREYSLMDYSCSTCFTIYRLDLIRQPC